LQRYLILPFLEKNRDFGKNFCLNGKTLFYRLAGHFSFFNFAIAKPVGQSEKGKL